VQRLRPGLNSAGPNPTSATVMYRHRLARRLYVWIGVAACLLGTLVPSVSHLLAAEHGGSRWIEVCSMAGLKMHRAAHPGDPAAPAAPASHNDCPYCVLGVGALGLPPPVIPALVAVARAPQVAPVARTWRPRRAHNWLVPAPRGPPRQA
jgi:hypothetical protein